MSPATIPAVEAACEECLRVFDDHILAHPYLLGERPRCADFGLITFSFAHGPHPSRVMKQYGPRG